ERRLGFRVPLRIRLRRAYRTHALSGYLGAIATLTALLLSGLLFMTWTAGAASWVLVLLGILGLVPASDIAVSLVHRLVPLLVPPRLLPKLELAPGVPPELRTLVVVPTLLTRQTGIEEQLERLEVHYLANPEGHLHFTLLTDWADAREETMPGDQDLLAALADGIAHLNVRYGSPPGGGERFLLLHRRRLWNEKEGKWIGWERKRGKLHELNRLLRGAGEDRKSTRLNSSHVSISYAFFCFAPRSHLHSFPTRRSSDLSPRWPTASRTSTCDTGARPGVGSGSFCCIAGASGTRKRASGSAGRGSAGSSMS